MHDASICLSCPSTVRCFRLEDIWRKRFRSAMVPEKTPSILGQSAGARGAEECTERVAASTAPHRTATKALYGGWWTWFQSTHQLPSPTPGWALLCLIYTCRPFPAGGQRKTPATAGLSYQHTPRCHLRASAISTHPTTREKCEMTVS